MINFQKIRTFEGGYSTDMVDNIERKNTYQKAKGGRLYSKNGIFSFSGGKGSRLIYSNSNIVKYLGFYDFGDELIIFAKTLKGTVAGGTTREQCDTILSANSFTVLGDSKSIDVIALGSEIGLNSNVYENRYTVNVPPVDEADFSPIFTEEVSDKEIDLKDYYSENPNVPNRAACDLNNENSIPINNEIYDDCIYSLKLNDSYALEGVLLWVGLQNWSIEGKISTEGVDETQFYKRVYYTDAINPRRVVNIKDKSLAYRNASEFDQILDRVLLQPRVVSLKTGGSLKAMKVLYAYRIVSANGQASEFSPASDFYTILIENEAPEYEGGSVGETTDKRIELECDILNHEPTSEIECIALEYEADGPPTSIRNLGRKSAAEVVFFDHYGTEAEFADAITYNDIIEFKNTWKYCNAFSSKKNKLIAGGLRNQPVSSEITNLEYLLPLHSWSSEGDTHQSLINPKPWEYRYVDPSSTQKMAYAKKKLYKNISSFGSLKLTFKNKVTGDFIEKDISGLNTEHYTDITSIVSDWLLDAQATHPSFSSYFPNVKVERAQSKLLMLPIDESLNTDFTDFEFESSNSQFIEDYSTDLTFLDTPVDVLNLVYGAQSIGFHQGVGIRITFREVEEPLLNQATKVYDGEGPILDFQTPSGEKYFMKGELYRLAFNAYNNDSTRMFAITLGDLMIPALGDLKSSIDDSGNAIITSTKYTNQIVKDGVLYGVGIKMHVEVRLSCALQKQIPMYQLVYVERNEENRTILCQGIASPLHRVQYHNRNDQKLPDVTRNKWLLPYSGGPTFEHQGFKKYDEHGPDYDFTGESSSDRIITHRGLMSFDSPDLYFDKISSQHIKSSKLMVVGRLNTDHTPGVAMIRGGDMPFINILGTQYVRNYGNEVYPKFSRKMLEPQIEGDLGLSVLPRYHSPETCEGFFYNVSVYAKHEVYNKEFAIDSEEELLRGQIVSGSALDTKHDISNNTFGMSYAPWYYSNQAREWHCANSNADRPTNTFFENTLTSPGYKTHIIKTTNDLFTEDFLGDTLPRFDTQVRKGGSSWTKLYDTVPLINIYKNNRESVFGGRSYEAYSKNTYIPLSRTIPTLRSSNNSQIFDVGGDIFLTLNIRTKNDGGKDSLGEVKYKNSDTGYFGNDYIKTEKRNNAWMYAVVLESQVESKMNSDYEFYRREGSFNLNVTRKEDLNKAYFNENNLKSYVPKPFNFKDDPNQGNVIAVSDTKLAGEYFDAWTLFKPNNFYALLEKDKGDISNFVKEKEELFAIQKKQTSLIYIGTDRILTDKMGSPINVKQGSGVVVDGHKVISEYGTSIRRAVIESDYGFSFFDNKKIEFVKINKPLLSMNFLHLEYFNKFKEDPIVDTEAFFDHENKETCIRIRTRGNNNFTISYNEVLKKFNGEFPYDNDIFPTLNERIYAPLRTVNGEDILSEELHQLNNGDILNFFNEQTDMVLGFYMSADINKVIQYKQVGIVTNLEYPIKQVSTKSNLGYDRVILGTHNWYKIREGIHTVPLVNESNIPSEYADVRGSWVYIEITAESLNRNKVNILAVLNDLRYSHQ